MQNLSTVEDKERISVECQQPDNLHQLKKKRNVLNVMTLPSEPLGVQKTLRRCLLQTPCEDVMKMCGFAKSVIQVRRLCLVFQNMWKMSLFGFPNVQKTLIKDIFICSWERADDCNKTLEILLRNLGGHNVPAMFRTCLQCQ